MSRKICWFGNILSNLGLEFLDQTIFVVFFEGFHEEMFFWCELLLRSVLGLVKEWVCSVNKIVEYLKWEIEESLNMISTELVLTNLDGL